MLNLLVDYFSDRATVLKSLKSKIRLRRTVGQNVEVGDRFVFGINSYVWAPTSLSIGSNVSLGSNVRIEADGLIGDHVLIANSAAIVGKTDHKSDQIGVSIRESRWVGKYPVELSQKTVIGSDVWIGFGAIIVSGVTIGDSSIVGAGSVVTRSIPENSIAVGNPARVIRQRFDESSFEAHWNILSKTGVRKITETFEN